MNIFGELVEELRHRHEAPQPATCGQCQEGLVVASGCTCGDGLPPYGHEPLCGLEPCPNGCWDILHAPSQAPAPQPVNLKTDHPEGEPVSVITDAKTGLHDVLARLEAIDEATASKLEAIQGNQGAMAIVDAALAAAHVPPEGFSVVVATLQGLADLYRPAEAVPAQPAAAQ